MTHDDIKQQSSYVITKDLNGYKLEWFINGTLIQVYEGVSIEEIKEIARNNRNKSE